MDSTIALLSEDQATLVYNALSFGTAVMLGAFVYFLTQMSAVNKEYRPAVAASAVVVGIAGYHYYRIWEGFSNGEMSRATAMRTGSSPCRCWSSNCSSCSALLPISASSS